VLVLMLFLHNGSFGVNVLHFNRMKNPVKYYSIKMQANILNFMFKMTITAKK